MAGRIKRARDAGRPGLRARIGVVIAAAMVGLSAFALAVAPVVGELRNELAEERQVVVAAATDLAALGNAVRDQETGQRGYLIARQEIYLEPYLQGREEANARLDSLARFDEVDGLDGAIDDLRAALVEWQTDVAEPQIALARFGTAVEDEVVSGEGRRIFGEVRAALGVVQQALDDEGVRVRERIDEVLDRLLVTVLVLFAIGGVGALALWPLLGRWLSRPVEALVREVGRVRAGDLDNPVRIDGPAELRAVAEATDAMRAALVEQLREVTRAREALEQRAPAVVALREELHPSTPVLPDGLDVATFFEPAEGLLAGDFADVLALADGRVALVVADSSGHGAEVVVRAIRGKQLLASALLDGLAPAAAFAAVAPRLFDADGSFVSAVVVVVDAAGVIRWANAGHPAAVVRAGGRTHELDVTGPVLGPVPGPWEEHELAVEGPWSLVAYSDGLVEARRADREQFGEERLKTELERLLPSPVGIHEPALVAAAIPAALRGFLAGARPADDITLVAAAGEARWASLDRSPSPSPAHRPV